MYLNELIMNILINKKILTYLLNNNDNFDVFK